MKAIILASGAGKRLMPLTEKTPKPLIEIGGGFTILERILQSLIENNINDIIITTGPFEEKIKALIKKNYPEINATYVKNPDYQKTNYIYSLWLAKDVSRDSDIVLVHGDLVYDFELMKHVAMENKTCVLVKKGSQVSQKDFKAEIKDGLITRIGVNVFGKNVRDCMPLYKFLKADFGELLDEMEKFIKENKTDCYAEEAFNKISDKLKLHPVYYDKEFCMEVDNPNDLKKAKRLKI